MRLNQLKLSRLVQAVVVIGTFSSLWMLSRLNSHDLNKTPLIHRTLGVWSTFYDEHWERDVQTSLVNNGYIVFCDREGSMTNITHPEIYRRIYKVAPNTIRIDKLASDKDVLAKPGEKPLNARTELRLQGFQLSPDRTYRVTIQILFDQTDFSAVFLQIYARDKFNKASVIFQTQVKNGWFSVRRWLTDRVVRGDMEQVELMSLKTDQWMTWEYEFCLTNKGSDGFIRLFIDGFGAYEFKGQTYWTESSFSFWIQTGVYENIMNSGKRQSLLFRNIKLESMDRMDS